MGCGDLLFFENHEKLNIYKKILVLCLAHSKCAIHVKIVVSNRSDAKRKFLPPSSQALLLHHPLLLVGKQWRRPISGHGFRPSAGGAASSLATNSGS
jgi:hypothetical protein